MKKIVRIALREYEEAKMVARQSLRYCSRKEKETDRVSTREYRVREIKVSIKSSFEYTNEVF